MEKAHGICWRVNFSKGIGIMTPERKNFYRTNLMHSGPCPTCEQTREFLQALDQRDAEIEKLSAIVLAALAWRDCKIPSDLPKRLMELSEALARVKVT